MTRGYLINALVWGSTQRISPVTICCHKLESLGYIFVADMGLISDSLAWWLRNLLFSAKNRRRMVVMGHNDAQGHSRSPMLVPMESDSYELASYLAPFLRYHRAQLCQIFAADRLGMHLEETSKSTTTKFGTKNPQKASCRMVQPHFDILYRFGVAHCDGQTDRQTGGIATTMHVHLTTRAKNCCKM